MIVNDKKPRAAEAGSALVYILIAIALLAALTVSFMSPSSQQTSSQNTFKTLNALQGQVDMIRSSIQECVLSYPKGDACINGEIGNAACSAGVTDPDARENYPINPDSAYYASATPGQSGDRLVRNLRCPGNNPGGVDFADHEPIFAGASGKFLPPPADLFGDFQYYNGTDGVFFWTQTDKTDSFIITSLTKLDEKFGECEADVIDARTAAQDLDSNSEIECPIGNVCFRVWMIVNTDSVFNGDTDADEASC
jgi:hypothetical protein